MDNSQNLVESCSLLVVSCDAYSDLWCPFFTLLGRFWTDCPFPLYLGAGCKKYDYPKLATLSSACGRDWAGCVRDYLEDIPTPYVLMVLDDFFLRGPVRNAEILRCLGFAQLNNAIQVRLIPRPGPTQRVFDEELIGECECGLPYRLSTQAAIWDRLALINLLRPGESIWEFEHSGNQRILQLPKGFYATWRQVLPYQGVLAHHVIEKGKWIPHQKLLFGRKKVGCDFSQRATLPVGQTFYCICAEVLAGILGFLPWRVNAQIRRTLKRILSPFIGKRMISASGQPSR